jgi:hypothetical protein
MFLALKNIVVEETTNKSTNQLLKKNLDAK